MSNQTRLHNFSLEGDQVALPKGPGRNHTG